MSKKKATAKQLVIRVLAGVMVFGMIAVIVLSALLGHG